MVMSFVVGGGDSAGCDVNEHRGVAGNIDATKGLAHGAKTEGARKLISKPSKPDLDLAEKDCPRGNGMKME